MQAYAPKLKIVMHYDKSRNYDALKNGRHDVVITTPHMKLNNASTTPFHRLIIDESHLLCSTQAGGYHAKLNQLRMLSPTHIWLVTGTPFNNSGYHDAFNTQLEFLGHVRPNRHTKYNGVRGGDQTSTYGLDFSSTELMKQENVQKLRKILIHHSKSQRIHGEVALKLPDLTCRTELLDFSADERTLYQMMGCSEGTPRWLQPWAHEDWAKDGGGGDDFNRMRVACSHLYGRRDNLGLVRAQTHGATDFPPLAKGPAKVLNKERAAAWERLHTDQYRDDVTADDAPGAPPQRSFVWDGSVALDDEHEDVKVETKKDDAKAANKVYVSSTPRKFGELTKPKKLVAEMKAMQAADPKVRVIVFTEHNTTQVHLVELFNKELGDFVVYEFNQRTAPVKRHKIIREFQNSAGRGDYAAACIATYATAAVGVTLTAASRVYLFEPCLDAGTEAQAAGRIHRLGQTKEIHVVRLAFRNSIEHAIVEQHEGVKSGSITKDTAEGRSALRDLYKKHGLHSTHQLSGSTWDTTEERIDYNKPAGFDPVSGRYKNVKNRFRLTHQKCSSCGASVLVNEQQIDHGGTSGGSSSKCTIG